MHQSISGIPRKKVYTRGDVPDSWWNDLESNPGEPPFIRGAYPDMYRSKLWRIFQLSGYGSPTDMNERLKFLLNAGETGIIIKHDRMTDEGEYHNQPHTHSRAIGRWLYPEEYLFQRSQGPVKVISF